MANPVRGEVSLPAGGETFTLVFDINTLCVLEDHLDMSAAEIAALTGPGMRLGFLRSLLWAGLSAHHKGLDLEAAGAIIHAAGIRVASIKVIEALNLAFPASGEAAGGDPGPQTAPKAKRPAGTGRSSSPSGAS